MELLHFCFPAYGQPTESTEERSQNQKYIMGFVFVVHVSTAYTDLKAQFVSVEFPLFKGVMT